MNSKTKDIVIGLGEIGKPLLKLLSKGTQIVGYDLNPKLMNKRKFNSLKKLETRFLHICIPFKKNFEKDIINFTRKFLPKVIVIHGTIEPYTTKKLQNRLEIPVIYSATRGVHKRMLFDLKRYTKFYAIEKAAPRAEWASKTYEKLMKRCGVKTKKLSNSVTLEFAKIICDTTYYGWLICYAQLSNQITVKNKINYDEMWSFAEEIHKFLGNRPKMHPGYIGGHCVIPNLDLINNQTLDTIKKLNSQYLKK